MAYPPSIPAVTRTDATTAPTAHPADHNTDRNALIDLVAELGTDPSGASADVTARLAALDTTVAGKTVTLRGTTAEKDATPAGSVGRLWVVTDGTQATYRDNGVSWDQIAPGQNEPALFKASRNAVDIGTRRKFNFSTDFAVSDVGASDRIDIALTASPTTLSGRKLAAQTILTNVALANVTDLGFAVAPSEVWQFQMVIWYDGSTTGDILLGFTAPIGSALTWQGSGIQSAATTNTDTMRFAANDDAATRAFGAIAVGTKQYLIINGIIVNGVNAGTVQLQFSQNALDVTNATRIFQNSFYRATRI